MDDLNKTLPASNTSPNSSSDGNVSSVSLSSSAPPTTPSTNSSTSSPLNTAHDADSLDKILADLEAQLKAKQDGVVVQDGSAVDGAKKEAQTHPPRSVTSPASSSTISPSTPSLSPHSPLVVKKPAEIMVEEKHELMNVKSDIKADHKLDSVPSAKPTSSQLNATHHESDSMKSVITPSVDHSFTLSPGIAAAQKKVVPETVGAVSVSGMNAMKKDTAVPTPPSMPGIADMTNGGTSSPVKPKKRNRSGVIIGIALLVFTMVGTAAGIALNWQPGGVFDPRRYAADNMCNVNPGSCTTEEQWISGWYDARKEENKNEVAKQDEYTNARDDQNANQAGQQVEIIRHAGEAGVGDPGAGNRTGEQATVTNQTITKDEKGNTIISTTLDKNPSSGATPMGGTGGTGPAQAAAGGGLVIPDLTAGQTIGNACNNPSKYKSCSSYQDWVDGYYAAKTDKFKGITATQPEYTDAIKDLDGDPSNGFQSGVIQFNPTTNKFEVTQAFTLNVPDNFKDMSEEDKKKYVQTNHPGIDPAKSFSVAVDANGKVVLTSTGTGSGSGKSDIPDAWKALAKNGCNQPSGIDPNTGTRAGANTGGGKDLYCHGSNGVDFCVPNGWSSADGKTCDGYFKDFGIPVRYQAFGINKYYYMDTDGVGKYKYIDQAHVQTICGKSSPVNIPSSLGTYSQTNCDSGSRYISCVNHGSYFTCYEKPYDANGKLKPNSAIAANAGFKISSDGNCLESSGSSVSTQFNGYNCPKDSSGGCQDNPQAGSGKICISDVIKNAGVSCGRTIQIDADDANGNHYSINEWLPECGKPSIPPVIIRRPPPPTTNVVCTTNCGGPEPTPSPAPPGSPVCVGISASIPSPRLGQAPTFTCSPAAEATRYEFRSKIGAGAYATLAPSAANSNVSSPLTVNASGVYTIQCRPCNANGCANWENL